MTPLPRRPAKRGQDASPNGRLNPKQGFFVDEYLVDFDARAAAMRAGYSPRSAHVQASELLNLPKIQLAIQRALRARQARTQITQDRVLEELALLAFSSVDHYEVDAVGRVAVRPEAPVGAIRAISSIKHTIRTDGDGNVTRDIEFRLWDKPGPLKLAGQHVGLFTKKIEISGAGGGPIEVARRALVGLTDAELAAVEKAASLTGGAG